MPERLRVLDLKPFPSTGPAREGTVLDALVHLSVGLGRLLAELARGEDEWSIGAVEDIVAALRDLEHARIAVVPSLDAAVRDPLGGWYETLRLLVDELRRLMDDDLVPGEGGAFLGVRLHVDTWIDYERAGQPPAHRGAP